MWNFSVNLGRGGNASRDNVDHRRRWKSCTRPSFGDVRQNNNNLRGRESGKDPHRWRFGRVLHL